MSAKLDYNKKLIGQKVFIVTDGGWSAVVVSVKDEYTVTVTTGKFDRDVDIFDIRSIEEATKL